MSVTLETSHFAIGPCGPSEQSLSNDMRHTLIALLSCALEYGENAAEGWGQSSEAEL